MRLIFFFMSALFMSMAYATPVSNPDFQPIRDSLELKSTATAKWMVFVTVYDAGLYADVDTKPRDILKKDIPITLEIRYLVDVKKDQLIEAANVALQRQHTEKVNQQFHTSVEQLHHSYQDVKEGDRFRIDIRPESGLSLYFNDKLRYQNPSLDFAKYYVGLWLADNPLSDDVRDALLKWSN